MAIIDCPECGHKVNEYALACPNCGSPQKKARVGLFRPSNPNDEKLWAFAKNPFSNKIFKWTFIVIFFGILFLEFFWNFFVAD